jgi:hypothetical protein
MWLGWVAFGFLLLFRHYVAGWYLVISYYFATTWLNGIYIKLLGYKKTIFE